MSTLVNCRDNRTMISDLLRFRIPWIESGIFLSDVGNNDRRNISMLETMTVGLCRQEWHIPKYVLKSDFVFHWFSTEISGRHSVWPCFDIHCDKALQECLPTCREIEGPNENAIPVLSCYFYHMWLQCISSGKIRLSWTVHDCMISDDRSVLNVWFFGQWHFVPWLQIRCLEISFRERIPVHLHCLDVSQHSNWQSKRSTQVRRFDSPGSICRTA